MPEYENMCVGGKCYSTLRGIPQKYPDWHADASSLPALIVACKDARSCIRAVEAAMILESTVVPLDVLVLEKRTGGVA